MNKKIKIGFLSSSDFCIPMAEQLLQANGKTLDEFFGQDLVVDGFEILGNVNYDNYKDQINLLSHLEINFCIIVSQPDNLTKGKYTPNPISVWANTNNIPLWNPENINKERNEIFNSLDLVVTASFGQLISSKLLEVANYGYINWHPSLLPKYRGPTPMQSTIVNLDQKYGLSWITMTKGMDAGKILLQLESPLDPNMDFNQMSFELGQLGGKSLHKAIEHQILNIGQNQDESKISYCSKVNKEDQILNPSELEAKQIHANHKAFIRFPGTKIASNYFGSNIKIRDCTVIDQNILAQSSINKIQDIYVAKIGKKQIVFVKCKNNTLLQINKIVLESGKQIELSGYQFPSI